MRWKFAPSLLPSKLARPSWSAVSAMAVAESGTQQRLGEATSAREAFGFGDRIFLSRLSIAQNGGGFSRTAATHGRHAVSITWPVEHGGSSIDVAADDGRFVAVGRAGAWSVSAVTVVWLNRSLS